MSLDKVIQAVAKNMRCDIEDVSADSNLADLGIDSLKAINILFDLEEEFDIEIPNDIIADLVTVRDIETTITRLLEQK